MGKTYEKFLRSGIDLATLGVERGENETYFCTPRGASIIGWEGVDGIHYCFVRGYGGVVFAVSPMNAAPDWVHAVARDFSDFLRLLLACGHAAAVEQCWAWSREQFDAYIAENPPAEAARGAMAEIREKLALEPMDDPWGYIHEFQSGFDYGKIKYSDPNMMDEPAPDEADEPWEVCYPGGGGKPGEEIAVDARFDCAGHEWRIPAVYACREGLVVDVAVATDADAVRAFLAKWAPDGDTRISRFSKAERLRLERENPTSLDFEVTLTLNGRELKYKGMSGSGWAPIEGWENRSARRTLEHYGLDKERCWQFSRIRFPWGQREEIASLSAAVTIRPADIPGETFTVSGAGDALELTNPETGEKYTLTVCEYGPETLRQSDFGSDEYEYPLNYTVMEYTLAPDDGRVSIRDSSEGDRPRRKSPGGGFASGGVFAMLRSEHEGRRYAASSMYFEAPERIEWLPVFRAETPEGAVIELI